MEKPSITDIRRQYLSGQMPWETYRAYEAMLTVRLGDDAVSGVSSALAAKLIEQRLREGATIEIPSRGDDQDLLASLLSLPPRR